VLVANKIAGAAVVRKTPQGIITVAGYTIGSEKTCSPPAAELKAIELAMRPAVGLPNSATSYVWIFSDNFKAVQAFSQPRKVQTGQECVRQALPMIGERQQQHSVGWLNLL
jgi:hypothetical protein